MVWLIKGVVLIVGFFVFFNLIRLFLKSDSKFSEVPQKLQLLFTGFIANVADTLGIGSFAVVVAMNNRWKFVDDKRLPGTLNAHSVLPAVLQSILFLNFVEIDLVLLVSFVGAACVGGLISGSLVARFEKQTIRLAMCVGFLGIGLLILAHQLHWLPIGGEATTLPIHKLLIGIPAMLLVGMLPAIGAGFYVPIQIILFLLGLSPLVAFPIMTTAGAIAQPMTAYAFIKRREVATRESLLMAFSGLVGVAVAVPVISYVNFTTLRWLLLGIVFYNAVVMWRTYQAEKKEIILSQ